MRKATLGIVAVMLSFGLVFSGCSKVVKKAESSRAAVEVAKEMQGKTTGKVGYLLKQAQAFYDAKDYRGAVDISQYILWHLDRNSKAAQDMLSNAKTALTEELNAKREALKAQQAEARKAREKMMAEEAARKAKQEAERAALDAANPASPTTK